MKNTINIVAILVMVVCVVVIVLATYEFLDMLNDHYCYQLPSKEFYEEPKCKKYWRNK